MSVTEETLYGGSEELAITANASLHPGKRVHVITSADAPRALTLPDATHQSSCGGGNHRIYNDSGYALAVKDYDGTTIKALADGYGVVLSLVDRSTQAGEWEEITFAIDSGPAPPDPVEGFFVGGASVSSDLRHWAPSIQTWTVYEDATPGELGFWDGATTFVVGAKGYITRESPAYSGNLRNAELDPINTWALRTGPSQNTGFGSSAGANDGVADRGYLFGGTQSPNEDVEVYTPPPTDSWAYGTAAASGRKRNSSVTYDDIVHVLGGATGTGYMAQVNDTYDPSTATWGTALTSIPREGRGAFTAAATSTHIFITCGLIYNYNANFGLNLRDNVDRYDPSADSWAERTPHPGKLGPGFDLGRRYEHAMIAIDDMLYQTGGWSYDGPDYPYHDQYREDACRKFDDATDTWTTQTPMDRGIDELANHSMAIQT